MGRGLVTLHLPSLEIIAAGLQPLSARVSQVAINDAGDVAVRASSAAARGVDHHPVLHEPISLNILPGPEHPLAPFLAGLL
eukprot:scaffold520544_cov42-Prasinocladus_malaysianus.AAC.1